MKSNLLFKVFAIVLSIPLIALIFGGCSDKVSEESSQTNSSAPTSSSTASSAPNSEASSTPLKSEESAPKGKPTFLICPDGTPVYTSEISEICARNEFDGNLETLTLEQAELTGYVNVWEDTNYQGADGTMVFIQTAKAA